MLVCCQVLCLLRVTARGLKEDNMVIKSIFQTIENVLDLVLLASSNRFHAFSSDTCKWPELWGQYVCIVQHMIVFCGCINLLLLKERYQCGPGFSLYFCSSSSLSSQCWIIIRRKLLTSIIWRVACSFLRLSIFPMDYKFKKVWALSRKSDYFH